MPKDKPATNPAVSVSAEELRKLALGWRWWAETQCAEPRARVERLTWVRAARELERLAGLETPDQAAVHAWGETSDA